MQSYVCISKFLHWHKAKSSLKYLNNDMLLSCMYYMLNIIISWRTYPVYCSGLRTRALAGETPRCGLSGVRWGWGWRWAACLRLWRGKRIWPGRYRNKAYHKHVNGDINKKQKHLLRDSCKHFSICFKIYFLFVYPIKYILSQSLDYNILLLCPQSSHVCFITVF